MRSTTLGRSAGWIAALMLAAAVPATAQSRVVLPAGTVIIVRMTTPLQSATAKVGQTFETVVEEGVGADETAVIAAGSKIRGVITAATPATRQQSGMIDVDFDQLMQTDGTVFTMDGKLTSTDTTERRQIAASNPNARVVLVGGRGGIGAAIAAAGTGRSSSSILGALGELLSEGRNVDVPAGTLLAVELERALTLRGRGRLVAFSGGTLYTAADRVRSAQTALQRLGYYRGSINGTLDDATRRALFEYQVDRGMRATGNLDGRTAQALGLNFTGGLTGAVLSAEAATKLRRDAQNVVARHRTEIGASQVGRLDASRGYAQADLDLWFALSAFADNASLYEQIVRSGNNPDAAVLAGQTLVGAMRRVDAAIQAGRTSVVLRSAWTTVRTQLSTIASGS
jgi:peptidoglycan hydrolase-like protein with peptidoglycan-binding domain